FFKTKTLQHRVDAVLVNRRSKEEVDFSEDENSSLTSYDLLTNQEAKHFILILVLHVARLVCAQNDQSGFISIDCGIDKGADYTGSATGINYVSDDRFIDSGENYKLTPSTNGFPSYLTTLRSFPENERNCYTLSPRQGKNNRYLMRARFLHGNYDPLGQGNPFISGLELRLLDITMYEGQFESLFLVNRHSFGNKTVRYEDDMYDRIWYPLSPDADTSTVINSGLVSAGPSDEEKVPLAVMRNAVTTIDSTYNLLYYWSGDTSDNLIIYIHVAEVEILKSNQTREFNIYLNGNYLFGPISPKTTITTLTNKSPHTGLSRNNLQINQTKNSNVPPIYNAIEIYTVKQLQQYHTEDQDAAAIRNTKTAYGLKRNWQGDPCVPQKFLWEGLNCDYDDLNAAKIISLNLSSSGLSGKIVTALANLSMIESLDLSYNNLTGTVPQILASLDNLKLLNLTGNNFTRPLPAELLAKSKKGSLFLSIEVIGDQDKDLAKKDDAFKQRNQQYTYSEVKSITNNFTTVIGKGGFGTVFRGSIEGNQVAVKMLSESSSQGYKEFQAEVKLLMNIRHKNITPLIGYCNDSNHKAIIYEYMANGDLRQHLFDESSNVLSWERRLQIGCDAAEGLVYMHDGCRPPIVHRDVKPTNILLNEGFQAKLADFGMSRAFTTEDATYESTRIVGTLGYLDPEYHLLNRLTMKSDVYSFGIVLLELITSRRAVSENINIINWVKSTLAEGHVEHIIDPKLQGNFNRDTAWKVVELAIALLERFSQDRISNAKIYQM
ncbi:leucine-rich repeat transmembrane protein kinase protein, partial [Tanacetum coccineum]